MKSHIRDNGEGGNILLAFFPTPVEQSFCPWRPLRKGALARFLFEGLMLACQNFVVYMSAFLGETEGYDKKEELTSTMSTN
jgi:hypothetical protein